MEQELNELRQGLDASFSGRDAPSESSPVPEPDPEPQDEPEPEQHEERYTLAEAKDLLERRAPTGHIDPNNPSRSANPGSYGEPTLNDLRRQLDAGWSEHQRSLNEN